MHVTILLILMFGYVLSPTCSGLLVSSILLPLVLDYRNLTMLSSPSIPTLLGHVHMVPQ
jgi:hypothetical protein